MRPGLITLIILAIAAVSADANADIPPIKPPDQSEDTALCLYKQEGDRCELIRLDSVCLARKPGEVAYPALRCSPFASVAELDRAEARQSALPAEVYQLIAIALGVVMLLLGAGVWFASRRAATRRRLLFRGAGAVAVTMGVLAIALGALRSPMVMPGPLDASVYASALVLPGGVSRGPFSPHAYGSPVDVQPDAPDAAVRWGDRAPVKLFRAGDRDRMVGVFDTRAATGYIGAFDIETRRLLWWIGPFYHEAWFAFDINAEHLVVVDPRGRAHVVALASGLEVARIRLTDRVARVVAEPGGASTFWLRFKDGRQGSLDPVRAVVNENAPTPPWAAPSARESDHCPWGQTMVTCLAGRSLSLKPEGVVIDYALKRDDALIALGWDPSKAPSTLAATRLDPATSAARWRTALTSASPGAGDRGGAILTGDRLYVFYETTKRPEECRLAAIDINSGLRLWDISVDCQALHSRALVATASRIMLSMYNGLTILDAATGAALGAIGAPATRPER